MVVDNGLSKNKNLKLIGLMVAKAIKKNNK